MEIKELNNKIINNEIQNIDSYNIIYKANYNYIKVATSDNTRKAYQKDILHFISWGGMLPATSESVVNYLEAYAEKLNPRTLQRRITAIKNWHIYQGFNDPTSHPLVRKTLVGIQKVHGRPKDKAPALQISDLIKIASLLKGSDRLIDLRNNALLQIGFFGAFRRSEVIALKYENIKFMAKGIEIILPRSKTDQLGEGQSCAIPYGDTTICPVSTLKQWCEVANISSGYIFRAINKKGIVSNNSIKAEQLNIIIKSIAKKCNLPHPDNYSSHSLRRGFATSASQKGASISAIMRQGRWQNSNTALGYIEEGQAFENNAALFLLK